MLIYKKPQAGTGSPIICDCGGKVVSGERVSPEQNADMWFVCEGCGSKELLSHLLGMDQPHDD